MKKQSKGSPASIAISMLIFLSGGIPWFLLAIAFADYERFAVPVAAILAAIDVPILQSFNFDSDRKFRNG